MGVLYLPKNRKKCSIAEWSIVSLMMVFCLHTLAGVLIYNILHLPVNLLSMGIFNFLAGAAIWGSILFVYRRKQKYYTDPAGLIVIGILFFCSVCVGMMRFDVSFHTFRYGTSDSAVHFHRVLSIVNSECLYDSRFYLYLIDALVIKVLSPVVERVNYYRIFIACDVFMWFLSGAMFFALIRKYLTNWKIFAWGTAFVLLYFFGYPLNNLIYGFNYLGACVTLAAFVLYATRSFGDGNMQHWICVCCICVGNLAAALCYTQFMPVVFAGSVLYVVALLIIRAKKINYKAIAVMITACILFGAYGVYYIVIQGYGSLDVLFSNLEGEGPVYRDLWSNLFFFLIFIVMYVRQCVRKKKLEAGYFFLIPLIVYAGYFFWRVCSGKTAAYYFYKFHYLGWLYLLYIAFLGLCRSLEQYEKIYRIYAGIAGVILLFMLSGIENRLHEANVWWVPQTKADAYFDIYAWNRDSVINCRTDVNDDMQDIYNRVAALVEDENVLVPYLGSWENYWLKYYYNLTCQEDYYDYFLAAMEQLQDSRENMINVLEENVMNYFGNVKYLMVVKKTEAYEYGKDLFEDLPVVYENDYGIIYEADSYYENRE
jgi:hypothetical protein